MAQKHGIQLLVLRWTPTKININNLKQQTWKIVRADQMWNATKQLQVFSFTFTMVIDLKILLMQFW